MKDNQLLLVSLNDEQESLLWCYGRLGQSHYCEAGELKVGDPLPEALQALPVVVVISSVNLVLREVECPTPMTKVSATTLAYQCEETLLEDVEAFHWVILQQKGSCYLLAGYRHADMIKWLARLPFSPHKIAAFVPDVLAFPTNEEISSYTLRGEQIYCSANSIGYTLPTSWHHKSSGSQDVITLAHEAATLWCCSNSINDASITLLKGDFAPLPLWRRVDFWSYWAPIISVLLLVLSLLIGIINNYHQITQIEQQYQQNYHALFPTEKVPEDLSQGLKAKLTLMNDYFQQPTFFALAEQLLAILPNEQDYSLISLDFISEQEKLTAIVDTDKLQPVSYENIEGNQVTIDAMADESASHIKIEIEGKS